MKPKAEPEEQLTVITAHICVHNAYHYTHLSQHEIAQNSWTIIFILSHQMNVIAVMQSVRLERLTSSS